MSEDWKLALLKKLWSGEESDTQKLSSDKTSIQQKAASKIQMVEIDLHRYSDISDQLAATEKFLDKAILANAIRIKIIHGKGEGILRAEIIKLLKHHPKILDYKSLKDQYGETGAIQVRFKSV
jgi:DNA mismatch repair protein MutS2